MVTLGRRLYERSVGLLLIRVGTGGVFFLHGFMKWEHLSEMTVFFTRVLGLPLWVLYFIATIEVVGGVCLVFGIAARSAALIFGIEMLVALILTSWGQGWQPHELEALLAILSFGLFFTGPGRCALLRECDLCGSVLCNGGKTCPARS